MANTFKDRLAALTPTCTESVDPESGDITFDGPGGLYSVQEHLPGDFYIFRDSPAAELIAHLPGQEDDSGATLIASQKARGLF